MKRNFYKSTTALVMTLSLFQPSIASAQEQVTIECTPELIRDDVPCIDPLTKLLVLPELDDKKGGKPEMDEPPGKSGAAQNAIAAQRAAARALADAAKAEADAAKAEADAARAEAEAAADTEAKARAAQNAVAAERAAARALADAAKAEADAAKAEAAAVAASGDVLVPCDPQQLGVVCDLTDLLQTAPKTNVPDVPTVAPLTEAARVRGNDASTAEVETRTVPRMRTSAEDFDNAVSVAPKADGGGLSNLEKAGLLLLGAVVVGQILNNNEKVVANTGDRVVVQDQYGDLRVYKDDDVLLMQPGATVRTETFSDGSTRSFVLRADGTQIVTIRDIDGRVQRRVHIGANGLETTLIDDTRAVEPVDLRTLPQFDRADYSYADSTNQDALRRALLEAERRQIGRSFSLRQIREIIEVRELAMEINLEAITFETNSSAISAAQARQLYQIGNLMADFVSTNPREVFLIEGHTDAIGDAAYNLALSDRRAETVALALAEYFGVPPENMVVQGYGERHLKIRTLEAERANRRVAVRRITDLLN